VTLPAAIRPRRHLTVVGHPKPPKLATERTCCGGSVVDVIAKTVGSMWMVRRRRRRLVGFALWMAGLVAAVANDHTSGELPAVRTIGGAAGGQAPAAVPI